MTQVDIKEQLIRELILAVCRLGYDHDLIAALNSYGDTLTDEEVLAWLKDWNAHGSR